MSDLISRQDVIKILESWGKAFPIPNLVRGIKALPSAEKAEPKILKDGTLCVEVEDGSKVGRVLVQGKNHFGGLYYTSADRPKGEWIDWLGTGNEWECSECKCSIESHGSIAYKFCPMCGADMRGDTE